MNRAQIESLNPGLELDVLIAEHVMGWKWIYDDKEQPGETPYLISPRDSDGFGHVFYPSVAKEFPKVYPVQDMPPYSTDIKVAWKVVEKIAETRHWVLRKSDSRIVFGVYKHDENDKGLLVIAETVPLTICRTALLLKFSQELK